MTVSELYEIEHKVIMIRFYLILESYIFMKVAKFNIVAISTT